MKKILLTLSVGMVATQLSAQFVNNGLVHISEGAVVSVGMKTVNNGEFSNQGNLELKNDLENNAKLVSNGNLTLNAEGGLAISGSKSVLAKNVQIGNDVQLKTPLEVTGLVEFNSGLVFSSDDAPLAFSANAQHKNASDFSHVVGAVKKSGNGSFEFPIGDAYSKKAFTVTDLEGGSLTANYIAENPLAVSSELDYDVERVNDFEYWAIKSESAAPNVNVELANNEVVSLKSGVWEKKPKKGILLGSQEALFTSGKSKNFVKEIGVWPNPTSGEFNLKLSGMRDSDDILVDITNQDGTIVQSLKGKVSELRKAYRLPKNLATTNLKVRVINGDEVLTQSLILNK